MPQPSPINPSKTAVETNLPAIVLGSLDRDSSVSGSDRVKPQRADPLLLAQGWILVSALFSLSGWVASAAGVLNTASCAISVVLGLILLAYTTSLFSFPAWGSRIFKLQRRCSHALPALFVLVTALATLGGILYAPNNYDALTYRLPRVFHWLAHHGWHWIDTSDQRLNYSAVGYEWLMTPMFALTHSDRLFFLINVTAQMLLPGLTYTTFIRLGISKRMAWNWMWVIPAGYCFVLQAGSIGNDSFAATYALSSICFALRFKETKDIKDFWISLLAVGLLTGVKASNLPLGLPWLIAVLPSLGLLKNRLAPTALVALLSVCVSFIPLAFLNVRNCGNWTGDPENSTKMKLDSPFYGVVGNAMQIGLRNIMPPVMPIAGKWSALNQKWLNKAPFNSILEHFPRINLKVNEIPQEEASGLGLGVGGLAFISFLFGMGALKKGRIASLTSRERWGLAICVANWVALAVFTSKAGTGSTARVIIPYYPLAVGTILLLPGTNTLARKAWWKRCAIVAASFALPVVILTPSRPLWPALTVFSQLKSRFPNNQTLARAATVFSVYRVRADSLAPVRQHLTKGQRVVGFLGSDDPEASLWRPFGEREVVDIAKTNLSELGTRVFTVVATDEAVMRLFGKHIRPWVAEQHGRIVATEPIITKVTRGPQKWFVIELAHTL